MRRADIIGGLVIVAFSLAMIFVVFPREIAEGRWAGLPPSFFPMLLVSGIGIFGVCLVAHALLRPGDYADTAVPLTLQQIGMFAIASVVILLGVMAISYFGVWVGGPVLIASLMLFMGERNPAIIVPTSVIPVAVVYVLAIYVLRTPLP